MKRTIALAAAVLALAGCGSDGDGGEAAERPPATTEAAATGEGAGGAEQVSGEAIFSANCAGCHTLEAAGASAQVGPNLDDVRPDAERVARQVRTGGGAMPSFADQLSDAEIQAVAEYVAANAGG